MSKFTLAALDQSESNDVKTWGASTDLSGEFQALLDQLLQCTADRLSPSCGSQLSSAGAHRA